MNRAIRRDSIEQNIHNHIQGIRIFSSFNWLHQIFQLPTYDYGCDAGNHSVFLTVSQFCA
jgi:hypothetical protein